MDWTDILTVSLEKDLSSFSRFLSMRGIPHRIIEHGGQQVLRAPHDPDTIHAWFEQWCAGQLEMPAAPKANNVSYLGLLQNILNYPVVLITSALAVLVYLIMENNNALMSWLVFQDTRLGARDILYATASIDDMMGGQWWRILTPIFLHFSLLHLVFNGLWLVEFGRKIERLQSHFRLLVVIVATGIISNLCQYIHEPSILFGGLSGVVYGLFGYCWLWGYWESRETESSASGIAPLPGVAPLLLFWLLLCMSGILSLVGIYVANAAHIGGLLSGFLVALIYRVRSQVFAV